MLVIYNETSNPWTMKTINDRVSKIEITRTVDPVKKISRTIGITYPTNLEIGDIGNIKNYYTPVTVNDSNTNILFQHKSCSPTVIDNSKYNKDIMFINLNIGDMIVSNIRTENVFILSYIIMKGELILIAAVSDKDNKGLEVTLYNEKENKCVVYDFNKTESEYKLNVVDREVDPDFALEPYVFRKFRPACPTKLIYAMERDDFALNKAIDHPENHIIKYFVDYNSLEESIDEMTSQKYSAATLFVNKSNLKAELQNKGDYYNILETISNKFKIVNVLLNTGKVVKQ